MTKTKVLTSALALISAMTLTSCGESKDDAYERGYEDGANAVCDAVRRTAPEVERDLRRQRWC